MGHNVKQATHVMVIDSDRLNITVCPNGGYVVSTLSDRSDPFALASGVAAFSTADQCADWVREFLRNAAHRKFGPKGTLVHK